MKSLESIPPQVLLTFRDTLSAALRCSVTFADCDGKPISIERFRIHRRFTSRVCQLRHYTKDSPVKKHVCDAWDSAAAQAVMTSRKTYESQCGMGFWCVSVPVLIGDELVGQIQAGERWLDSETNINKWIDDGIRMGVVTKSQEGEYRREFRKSTETPNTISAEQTVRVRKDLELFARFLGAVANFTPEGQNLSAHTSQQVLNAAESFREVINSSISDFNRDEMSRLLQMTTAALPFSDNWLREFHDPRSLDPSNSRQRTLLTYVIFADLRGFTEACNNLGLEKVQDARQTLFTAALEIINKNGGVVDKFIGDAILAFFFSPTEPGIEEYEGESAEQRIAEAVGETCIELQNIENYSSGAALRFGIGVAHGKVHHGQFLYRTVDTVRREITGLGPPVNKASRLSALARKWGSIHANTYGEISPILLDAEVTKILVSVNKFHCRQVDNVRLKGFGTSNYEPIYTLERSNNDSLAPIASASGLQVFNLSQGFLSTPAANVIDAIGDYYEYLKHSRGSLPLGEPEHMLPPSLASLLKCSAQNITFRDGTTSCIEDAVGVIQLHKTRHNGLPSSGLALISSEEHSTTRTVVRNAGFNSIQFQLSDDGDSTVTDRTILRQLFKALEQLKVAPDLVIIPHVTHRTGIVMPFQRIAGSIREFCAEKSWQRPFILIDGAHALGHVKIAIEIAENVSPPFDFYVTCTHKWFRGPHGVGILVATQEILKCEKCVDRLAWGDCFTCIGGLGSHCHSTSQFRTQDRAKAYATLAATLGYAKMLQASETLNSSDGPLGNSIENRNRLWSILSEHEGVGLLHPVPNETCVSGILSISVDGFNVVYYTALRDQMRGLGILADVVLDEPVGLRLCVAADLEPDEIVEIAGRIRRAIEITMV